MQGPFPEIIFPVDPTDRRKTFACLQKEVVELYTMARFRRELSDAFAGASFLPPTKLNNRCVAGIQWEGRTVVVEASDFMGAYQTLWREAVEKVM